MLGSKVWLFEEVVGWELLRHAMGLKAPQPGMASSRSTGNESFAAMKTLGGVMEAKEGRHSDEMMLERLMERFMGQGCIRSRRGIGCLGLQGWLAVDVRAIMDVGR
jgi:hypothetical protein